MEPKGRGNTTVNDLSVSVVMSVYDNAEHLPATLNSVLDQQGVELELIVVDDGAGAEVRKVLASFADETRMRILRQQNQGLTKALIVGCKHAKMPYVARIDTGDLMMPGRLQAQASQLAASPQLGLICSAVEVVTPEGYPLYTVENSPSELLAGLTAITPAATASPFHASVMFRRSVYHQVGGYRAEFYFAQDLDLWARMIEVSELAVLETAYTRGLFSAQGLSGRYAAQQADMRNIIVALRALRKSKASPKKLLQQAYLVRPLNVAAEPRQPDFAGNYFIAKCLFDRQSKNAGIYLGRTLAAKPWSVKALYYYLLWRVIGTKWDE